MHLQEDDIALIKFEDETHYVVILNVNTEEVTIYNPFPSEEYGNEITIPFEYFEEVYMGYAITNEENIHGKYVSQEQLAQLKGKGGLSELIKEGIKWVLKNATKVSKKQLKNEMAKITKQLNSLKKKMQNSVGRVSEEIALQMAYDELKHRYDDLHHIYCERFGC
ncbi:MAG: hypothetical protein PHY59_03495 [Methanobacterium sp.]|nr:hypothetical protein [Methanobacterium sp.]